MSKLIIGQGLRQRRSEQGVMVLGVDLNDAREELFVRMVVDGIALGVAFTRAGFKSGNVAAASNLFALPRIQERANAILDARRSQGVITLPEVTDMLKRVFTGAFHKEEYNAAHNAAFSLARLYGHVTDKATLEVIRRPSRDPDAPSEQALASWVEALPALTGPGPDAAMADVAAAFGAFHVAPAVPLEAQPGPDANFSNDFNALSVHGPSSPAAGPGPQREFSNDFKGLASGPGPGPASGRPENGAPTRPVTEPPNKRGRSPLLAKGAPLRTKQVPVPTRGKKVKKRKLSPRYPSAKKLFG